LEEHVRVLAETIGERNVFRAKELNLAANYIEARLEEYGYSVDRQGFLTPVSTEMKRQIDAFLNERGAPPTQVRSQEEIETYNLVATRSGRLPGFVVIGAHYDSIVGSPGADDNATGVAALLELAAIFSEIEPTVGIRLVAFPNEEFPVWRSEYMGSYQYAKQLSERGEEVHAMISLETMGYYISDRGSQRYPPPLDLFYPSKGDILAFVSDLDNRRLVQRMVETFRDSQVPLATVGVTLPPSVARTDLSDNASFWRFGYPGVIVTDTAYLRSSHYHEPTDLPDTLNYEALALAVEGLAEVIADLVSVDRNRVQ
jgi:hypothetical protein